MNIQMGGALPTLARGELRADQMPSPAITDIPPLPPREDHRGGPAGVTVCKVEAVSLESDLTTTLSLLGVVCVFAHKEWAWEFPYIVHWGRRQQ